MNKYVKIVIGIAIVVAVFLFAFLATEKEAAEVINYNDYQNIKNSEGIVYYGSKDEKDTLKNFADSAGIEIGILDPGDLSKSEVKSVNLKEGNLYLYENGENVYIYDGEIEQNSLVSAFMKEGLIAKTYISIGLDEYLDIIKEDGYHLMFIGRDTCGYCVQFKDSINESLEDYDYDVYYLNLDNLTSEDIEKLYTTDEFFTDNEGNWGTPLTFLYKDGKRIAEIKEYVDTDTLISFLKENKVIR